MFHVEHQKSLNLFAYLGDFTPKSGRAMFHVEQITYGTAINSRVFLREPLFALRLE